MTFPELRIAVPRGALFAPTLDLLDRLGLDTREVRANDRKLLFEQQGIITMRPSDVPTSAEAGARKPAPAVFERALAIAGARAEHAIHIGDSLEEDVIGARRAGVEPVLLSRDGRRAAAGVRTIRSLGELQFDP